MPQIDGGNTTRTHTIRRELSLTEEKRHNAYENHQARTMSCTTAMGNGATEVKTTARKGRVMTRKILIYKIKSEVKNEQRQIIYV